MSPTHLIRCAAFVVIALAGCNMAFADDGKPVARVTYASARARAPGVRGVNHEQSADKLHPRIGVVPGKPSAPVIGAAGAAVTDATVGDADSFGRATKYLGLAQTTDFQLQTSCQGVDPTVSTCVTLAAQPAETDFDVANLGSISLPARSAHSLLCFTLTPFLFFEFSNLTGVAQPNGEMSVFLAIAIENPLLDNPGLIDPTTNAPFNGQIQLGLSTYQEFRSLAVGELDQKDLSLSRTCVGGIISRDSLVSTYGLTAAQAKEFFDKPITLSFGVQGFVAMVDLFDISYGIRVYGD